MFAIVGQTSSFFSSHHGYTEHLSFAPGLAHAQVALTIVDADADEDSGFQSYAEAYIVSYTHRPIPDGADELVNAVYDPVISATERLTGVTWAVGVDAGTVQARLDVFWWADVGAPVKPAVPFSVPPGIAAAVYDAVSGEIHHVHMEVTLLDEPAPDPAAVERRGLELAHELAPGIDLGNAKTLVVPGGRLRPPRGGDPPRMRRPRRLRVDVDRGEIVDAERD